MLATAPDYARRAGVPQCPQDLEQHELLRVLGARPEHEWLLRDGGAREVRVRVHGRFESDDTATLAAALYGGLGIGLLPRGEVKRQAAAKRLVHVLPKWHLQDDRIFLVSPPGRLRLPRVRAVAAIIQSIAELLG